MHRLRSVLTMLGIIFGVCSVIAMLAIGEGASQESQAMIARLGSMNLIIETVEPPQERADAGGDQNRMDSYGLTYKDAESIRNTLHDVEVVVPIREIDQEARYHKRKVGIKIIGSIPWFTEISPLRVVHGRFLSSIDLHRQRSVCVVDEQLVSGLFGFVDPVGKDVQIQGNSYRVIGVSGSSSVENKKNGFGNSMPKTTGSDSSPTGSVYLPLTTAKSRFSEIQASFSGGRESMQKVQLQKITVKVKSTDQVLPMRDILDTLLTRLHKDKKDYRIIVPLELLRQAKQTQRIFSIVLGSIAAISLLVGGIGIMNIMLATVSERTREIGIRRALGAKKRDIIIQFLSETLILTLSGGIVGLALGSLLPLLVEHFGNMPTVITGSSMVLSFGISGVIGVIFGLYPAYRAANMDPIESLRHE
ncbi:MAG: ABC transporter permease [Planctomycetes bacterium]|nr:ABC transporter permease [Planctomycetota bacterium]MBL7142912.1 ABC transporter permease [Phycisphaerae bacterium]